MRLSDTTRALILAAAEAGHAFALWRMPEGGPFRALVSTAPAEPLPLFDAGGPPFFAFAGFAEPDAARPMGLPASVLAEDGRLRFFDGARSGDVPVGDAQRRLAAATATGPLCVTPAAAPDCTGRPAYTALVGRTLDHIASGACQKVVLSRAELHALPEGYDLFPAVEALAQRYPDAFVSLVSLPEAGTWITATPETLLRADEDRVRTMALAGTQWPDPAVPLDALTWSEKIVEEQALVARFIRTAFDEAGFAGVAETGPRSVAAGHLRHLRSDFEAPRRGAGDAALARLVRALHPTPAVCGLPRDAALGFLRAQEGYDRRAYTGFLGPAGFDGRTDLFVNLRCAQIAGPGLCIYVGGGIVTGSEPDLEWTETEEKARVIGDVLLSAKRAGG